MIEAVYGVINVGEGKTLDDNDLWPILTNHFEHNKTFFPCMIAEQLHRPKKAMRCGEKLHKSTKSNNVFSFFSYCYFQGHVECSDFLHVLSKRHWPK